MTRKVCIAGATGWACAALTKAVHAQTDMQVAGAVSRTRKGEKLSRVLGLEETDVIISDSVTSDILADVHVLVEYTKPDVAMTYIMTALDAGVHVVVGTSGLPDQKLTLRHDAGTSAQPYVDGALLAIRKVDTFIGLRRGMDHVMDLD